MRLEKAYSSREGYFKLYLSEKEPFAQLFLGIRRIKDCDYYIIEDNLTNRIVLQELSKSCTFVNETGKDLSESFIPAPKSMYGILPANNLYDYQQRDVLQMIETPCILNANRMGYGKTIEAICTAKYSGVKEAIIIAPKVILEQWASQIKDWWGNYSGNILINPATPRTGAINIFNYEKVTNATMLTKLKSHRWQLIIVDESHRIKNPKAKRTIACISIPAQRKIALTGTPILKTPEDLYSQLYFLCPAYACNSYWQFREYYCEIENGFFGPKCVGLTTSSFKVKVLNELLSRVCIRNPSLRLTRGKQKEIIKLKMDTAQKKLYKNFKDIVLEELPEEATIPNGAVLTLRLQQATSCPAIFIKDLFGIKFEWIKTQLEDNPDTKFVVYTQFEKVATLLKSYLGKVCVTYIGKLDATEKYQAKNAFIKNPNIRVIVGTIAALGEGVDGLQQVSHTCVFIDRCWSPEILSQCEDRLNRIGQKELVNVYYLECVGSFDRHVGRINEHRAEDIRRALNDE